MATFTKLVNHLRNYPGVASACLLTAVPVFLLFFGLGAAKVLRTAESYHATVAGVTPP